jgi:hypothetical protein
MLKGKIQVAIVSLILWVGWALPTLSAAQTSDNLRIANVMHDGIHFSVAIDRQDNRLLYIVVPEKNGVQRPVRVRLQFRDDSKMEAVLEREVSTGNGGYMDWRYHFDAKRPIIISEIFSVTIWVGDQMFVVAPW